MSSNYAPVQMADFFWRIHKVSALTTKTKAYALENRQNYFDFKFLPTKFCIFTVKVEELLQTMWEDLDPLLQFLIM